MSSDTTILEKLDQAVPAPLARFDAFPKLPSTYKARSESRGFMTIFVGLLAFLLMLNDIGEFIWGWPDHEFSVDNDPSSYMNVNVDLTVNMPCRYLSVDLRDAVGDRLFLSGSLTRDGTLFDVSQATTLKAHSEALSARQVIAQSRSSRGFFSTLFRWSSPSFRPTYIHEPHGSACRIWGSLEVKKVTANLHITTLGHGYASYEHVDHNLMNLSHVITEFSFGPYFPDITQPLDYSFETTDEHFIAYQYFLHVVPTTYIAPRTKPLRTNQYSVTHYTRILEHNRGTPGIFFKFDLDPMSLTIHQRTMGLIQLIIRCVGVIGGVFVCMGYFIRITTRTFEVVTGADQAQGIVAAEATGAKVGLKGKWGGGELRARKMVRQGSGWVMDGTGSFADTPTTPAYGSPSSPYPGSPSPSQYPGSPAPSQYLNSPAFGSALPASPRPGSGVGLGFPSGTHGHTRSMSGLGGPPRTGLVATPSTDSGGFGLPAPGTPAYGHFPPTPNPAMAGAGFPTSSPSPGGGSPHLPVNGLPGAVNGNGEYPGTPPNGAFTNGSTPPPRRVSMPKKDD